MNSCFNSRRAARCSAGRLLLLTFLLVATRGRAETGAAQSTRWKGNLHTHSLWSDGDDFPEMIADWYKRNGYQFLTLSDHNVLADGERWVDVPAGKGNRELAVKKYVERFGNNWVEQRKSGEKSQVRLKPL